MKWCHFDFITETLCSKGFKLPIESSSFDHFGKYRQCVQSMHITQLSNYHILFMNAPLENEAPFTSNGGTKSAVFKCRIHLIFAWKVAEFKNFLRRAQPAVGKTLWAAAAQPVFQDWILLPNLHHERTQQWYLLQNILMFITSSQSYASFFKMPPPTFGFNKYVRWSQDLSYLPT